MDNKDKIQELFSNSSFVKELFEKNSAEEAQEFLVANGLELSLEEVEELGNMLQKLANGEIAEETLKRAANDELTEADLEAAAGGFGAFAAIAICALAGSTVGGLGVASYFLFKW